MYGLSVGVGSRKRGKFPNKIWLTLTTDDTGSQDCTRPYLPRDVTAAAICLINLSAG